MREKLQETIDFLKAQITAKPEIGIVLGTGFGRLVNEVQVEKEIFYSEIPHFPLSTIEFHSGKLIVGKLVNKDVVIMSGRFHLYEGYSFWEVTYGIRVMHALGIKKLCLSNAAGAVNQKYKKGSLMLLDDHINLQGGSPLAFSKVKEFGSQFTDMIEPYSNCMNDKLIQIAKEKNILLHKGVYVGVIGPQLETRAEYRMLKIIGADAVGMSTVPEVIVAKHLELEVVALSILTDECDADNLQPVNIPEIIQIVEESEPKLIVLLKELFKKL